MSSLTSTDLAMECLAAIRQDEAHHGQRAEIVLEEETARAMPPTFPNRRRTFFSRRSSAGPLLALPEAVPMAAYSAAEVLAWCLTTGVRPALWRRVDHYTLQIYWA